MKIKKASLLLLLSFLTFFLTGTFIQQTEASEIVKLSYMPINNESDGAIFIMTSKLKITNIGVSPIKDVVVSVYQADNITIDATQMLFDVVDVGKSKTSQDSFIITHDSSQENSDKQIIWQVQYTDTIGATVNEFISLH